MTLSSIRLPSKRLFISVLFFLASAVVLAADTIPAVIQNLEKEGIKIINRFDAPSGMTGYALRHNGNPLIAYVTGDGEHMIVGQMMDAQGRDLTRQHVQQHIPGIDLNQFWARLEKSAWVAESPTKKPKKIIYTFTDTHCPYCNLLWKMTRHYHSQGLQVRHILVSVLRPTSLTKAAAILQSENPTAALEKHGQSFAEGGIEPASNVTPEVQQKILANTELMHELGIRGTPAILYQDDAGQAQLAEGMPSPDSFPGMVGLKPVKMDDPAFDILKGKN